MIHLFWGGDAYRRDAALRAFVASLGPPDLVSLNTIRLPGRTPLPEIFAAADTTPFLAERRLVIVENFGAQFERARPAEAGDQIADAGAGGKASDVQATVSAYANRQPPTSELIFLDGELKAANPLLKAVQQSGNAQGFPVLQGPELERWIIDATRSRGGDISRDAAATLAERVASTWAASNEIDKLLAYRAGESIRSADVALLVAAGEEADNSANFRILNALEARNPVEALSGLREALAAGNHPLQILASLTTVYRRLLLIKAWQSRTPKVPDQQIMAEVKVNNPRQFDFQVRRLRRSPGNQIERDFRAIADTEYRIKTGLDPVLGLEMLVTRLAS